jgi:hypothetical protein
MMLTSARPRIACALQPDASTKDITKYSILFIPPPLVGIDESESV